MIADATNSTLIVSNAQSINEGYYQVTMANSFGTATSRPILLRVLPSKALIVSGPQPISVPAGTQAEFNANVIGSAPLTLQWYKNGALLAGAVSSQLVIPNAQAADAGIYQLLASNSFGNSHQPWRNLDGAAGQAVVRLATGFNSGGCRVPVWLLKVWPSVRTMT